MTPPDPGRDAGHPAARPPQEQEPVVVLRPRSASRALHDAPDARLCAGSGGLVLRRPDGTTEVLAAPGARFTAHWETERQLADRPRRRPSLPPAPDGPRLLLAPASGERALAVHADDWTDARPLPLQGAPGWAHDLAAALGTDLAGARPAARGAGGAAAPTAGPPVRRLHPDPLSRQRRWLQLLFAAVTVAPVSWGLLVALLPGGGTLYLVLLLLAQTVALAGLLVIGSLWLWGSRRLRAPLPRVTTELGPLGAAPTRHAAQRLRLGARPGELVVRDERGGETSLATTDTTWSRSRDAVRLLAPDGAPLLRLPLAVWAPDDAALVRLLDLLSEAGARPGPPVRGDAPRGAERVLPSPVRPLGGEVPGLPGYPWYGLATLVNALGAVWAGNMEVEAGAAPLVGTGTVRTLALAQGVAVLVVALSSAVAHRRGTATLRGGRMSGS